MYCSTAQDGLLQGQGFKQQQEAGGEILSYLLGGCGTKKRWELGEPVGGPKEK
jgi:hypothetical protein